MADSAGIIESILKWSKTRPAWQQDALRRLVAQGDLTPKDKEEIWNLARTWAGLPPTCTPVTPVPLGEADFPISAGKEELLKLVSIKELMGVNALPEGQTLSFGSAGLTVVFGENGAGKSGYFRVLKHACRARVVDPILGDVRQKTPVKPSANIEVQDTKGTIRSIKWEGGDPPSELTQYSLFDSACARQILGAASEPVFVPIGLGAFAPFSAILDGTREAFTKEIAKLEDLRDLDVARAELAGDHEVGRLVASFPGRGTKADIEALATIGDEEWEELRIVEARLKELAAADPSATIVRLRNLKARVQQEARRLATFRDTCSKDAVQELNGKWEVWQTAKKARELAQTLRSGRDPLPGVGSDSWRALYLAAERYSVQEAYKAHEFPVTDQDALCVFCMQPLGSDAKSRLRKFHDFIHDQSAKVAQKAEAEWTAALNAISSASLSVPDPVLLDEIEKETPKLRTQVVAAVEELRDLQARVVEACRNGEDPGDFTLKADVFQDLERFDEVVGVRIEGLASKNNAPEVAALTAKQAAMTARLRLGKHKEIMFKVLERKAAAQHIQSLMPFLTTRQITEMQKDMTSAAIAGPYGEALARELKLMGVDRFRLDYKSTASKGQVSQHLQLPDASTGVKPEQVLSEGERQVASLAAFLAEVSLRPLDTAIILDDPVNSLDHLWAERVAKRLVNCARDRQVIVFTHHLHFLYTLRLAAQESSPEVPLHAQNVRWSERRPGVIVDGLPWLCRGLGERMPELERLLAEARRHYETDPTGEEYVIRRARFVDLLRATWERTIEEGLFKGVVTRFQSEVCTLRLAGVVVGDEDFQAITRGMTTTSRRTEAHDHAFNAMESNLTPEEMKEALEELRMYLGQLRKRQNITEKSRK